ncbi:MAG: hypothetical protein AB7I48_05780 [Planctomycetaceae bacterium]
MVDDAAILLSAGLDGRQQGLDEAASLFALGAEAQSQILLRRPKRKPPSRHIHRKTLGELAGVRNVAGTQRHTDRSAPMLATHFNVTEDSVE